MIRPRRPDQRLLRTITDAGLPVPQGVVSVTALRQVSRSAPTAGVVEGRFTPWRITNSLTSFVVEHPKARFIVDPSICLDVGRRALAQLPAVVRIAVRPPADVIATVEALRELPGPSPLDFALPTHAHWDHVCGLLDLGDLPVHLHRPEREWISGGAVAPTGGVRDALRDRAIVDYELDGPPILTFTRSHDLFGDSTVLLVDLAGHTPGSVGVLAHTGDGWILLAGDAAWHTLQVEEIRQKSSYPGSLLDEDRDRAFETLHRLHLARHFARIVPTHDHQATQQLRAADRSSSRCRG
ncbi:MBL fold metallo-hydrolase [Nocardia sp. NPDC048505]|uniref:MBL fold metallo-hydrolase n=1 Tax=unclassified Nocardia TaxID=2637762 RepID=UPI0033FD602D